MNDQFSMQRDYLNRLRMDGPLVFVGAHYSGTLSEIRREAVPDHVRSPTRGPASWMAREGELAGALGAVMRAADQVQSQS